MPKAYGQKVKLLYVLDYLKKHTDKDNPMSADAVCERLNNEYGIPAARKSIYSDVEALLDYGYDIKSTKKGFYLVSRDFEEAEIHLLSDAVSTAKFITPQKTRELLKKLEKMLGETGRRKLKKNIYFDYSYKSDNEEIFNNINILSEAVSQGVKVEVEYVSREIKDRRFGKVVNKRKISPYALTWQDDHYYLIGNYEKYDNLLHLRVDRILKVEKTKEKSRHFSEVSEYKDSFDIADYTAKVFDMFSGNVESIKLRCDKSLATAVEDRFGEKIFITDITEEEFCFSFDGAISKALITFIMNFGDSVKVLKPKALQDMIIERAGKILEMYKN